VYDPAVVVFGCISLEGSSSAMKRPIPAFWRSLVPFGVVDHAVLGAASRLGPCIESVDCAREFCG
jgi:hypothetical protein